MPWVRFQTRKHRNELISTHLALKGLIAY